MLKLYDRFLNLNMHINCLAEMLALSPPPANSSSGAPAGNPLFSSPLVPMILMIVVFYFLLIRPQQKRAKELAKLVDSLKAGDKVNTSAGIIGVVVSVKDKAVTLRTGDAKIEITKASVTEILESGTTTVS